MKSKILMFTPIWGVLTVWSLFCGDVSAEENNGATTVKAGDAETVLTRRRPELEALGLSVGAFRLYPSLEAEVGSADNVKTGEGDGASDVFMAFSPAIKLRSQFVRHTFNANISGTIPRYHTEKEQNRNAFIADASIRLDLPRGWFVALSGSTEDLVEKPGLKLPANAQFPLTYNRKRAEIASGFVYNDLEATASFTFQRYNYDDNSLVLGASSTPLPLGANNRSDETLRFRVSYAISPRFSVYGASRLSLRRYELSTLQNRDSDVNALVVGARYSHSNIILVDLAVGGVDQKFLNPNIPDLTGLNVISNIEWSPTRLTTFRANFTRQEGDPFILEATSLLSNLSSIRVDHELLRNLVIMAEFSNTENKYMGIDRSDTFKTVTVGGRYVLNRRYAVKMNYSNSQLKSVGISRARDYKNAILSVGIVFSY